MSKRIAIHPVTPQPRRVAQVSGLLAGGGVVVYPTDSCYALGCDLANVEGIARIRRIRQKDQSELMSLLCRDLGEIAEFGQVDNQAFRLLRKLTPGPYTFILKATREVPKRLLESRRKTIGIRVPDNVVVQALLHGHGAPLISSTAQMPDEDVALNDPEVILDVLGHRVDAVVDGGICGLEPTSVIDLTGPMPTVLRAGAGDVSLFQ
ncbi:MAG: L-threonylcarbamoyladenylate synthase [Gammaproteobacteria bacterium]